WYLASVPKGSTTGVVNGSISVGGFNPFKSLSPCGPSGTLPEETEWDCSESFFDPVGGVTWTLMSVFLDLGFDLFLESAPEALGPCDVGKVGVTI
nr:hypothetical protein [Tanacetum cinerariifolium]